MTIILRNALIYLLLLPLGSILLAQPSLSVSSGSAPVGSSIPLSISINSTSGSAPASIQWSLDYPATSVAGIVITAGPVLTASGKTLTCASSGSGYKCLASGLNSTTIGNGVIANLAVSLSTGITSAALGISGGIAATPIGDPEGASGSSGTATGTSAGVTVKSLTCTPSTLAPGALSSCTVTLSGVVVSGATLAITSTGAITTPTQVAVASNASSASFNVIAGVFSGSQTASVTTTLAGSAASANLSLVAQGTPASVSCGTTVLPPSGTTTCTVTLTQAAPSGGQVVTLSNSAPSVLAIPATVTVAANALSATFAVSAAAVSADKSAVITATANGRSANVTVNVTVSLTLTALMCLDTTVAATGRTTCALAISKAAPAGGTTVLLSYSPADSLTIPTSVVVTAGAQGASFPVTVAAGAAGKKPTITASLNGSTRSASLTIPGAITLSLSCANLSLLSAGSTSCGVTLSGAAPAGGSVVTLTSSAPTVLSVPASVTVPAGATTVNFTATAGSVSLDQTATLTASMGTPSTSVNLTVASLPGISSVKCVSVSLTSLGTSACTVALSKAAPAGGVTIKLASGSALLSVPATISAAAGSITAPFIATAATIASSQTATITASIGSSKMSVTFSLAPDVIAPSSLTCNATTLTPRAGTSCTVRLSKTAPASGAVILLSASVPGVLTLPASITVPSGASSASFTTTASAFTTSQNVTLRASNDGAAVTFVMVLSTAASSLSQLTCAPVLVTPGAGGTCTVSLTAASTAAVSMLLRSTNTSLTVPISVTVPAGMMSASFNYTTKAAMKGWAIVSATLGTVNKTVTVNAAAGTASAPASSSLQVRCSQRAIVPGGSAVCSISGGDGEYAIATDSETVKAPAAVRGRVAGLAARFEVAASEDAPAQNVTIEVSSGSSSAALSLAVDTPGSLHLRVPGRVTAVPAAPVRFSVNASDDQGLPVTLQASQLPSGSAWDAASGQFEWVPGEADLGVAEVSFTAANSMGAVVAKTVTVEVVTAAPRLLAIRNGAGDGAEAACTPGTFAILSGTSLAGSSGRTRLRINGAEASILSASSDRIRFLCPQLAPETSLSFEVEAAGLTSNTLRATMRRSAPGLLTADGSGSGQGLATHARGLAALPRFDRDGMPAAQGEEIALYATGINCSEIPGAPKPLLYFGHDYQEVTMLAPSSFAGVCEVRAAIPRGVSGDGVGLFLETERADGSVVRSNTIRVSVE